MVDNEAILNFIRTNGPSLPAEIASHLKQNSMLVSAMLSTLLDSKKLVLSNLKVGRGRLYLIPGDEGKLIDFASHLKEKDRRTFERLKEDGVIRESVADPLTRVSLRNIPDFAKPLEVNLNGQREIFWKWYLLSPQDAEKSIKGLLGLGVEESSKPEESTQEPAEEKAAEAIEAKEEEQVEKKVVVENVTEEIKSEPAKLVNSKTDLGPVTETKSVEKKESESQVKEEAKEFVESSEGEITGGFDPNLEEEADEVVEVEEEKPKPMKKASVAKSTDVKEPRREVQSFLGDIDISDEFGVQVKEILESKGVEILGFEVVRKKFDIDFDIVLHARVGELKYYCKARNKKTINDGDLASAFVTGQMKKLPVLYVTPGKLTKKAEEKLRVEMPSITYMKIDLD